MAKTVNPSVSHSHGFSPFIGWGISTLLLWLLNRNGADNTDTTTQQASPYTDSNSNQIGQPIPVALGRVLIKNPLISYYGSFRSEIYTEEYGAHSSINVWPAILLMLIPILIAASEKDTIKVNSGNALETTGKTVEAIQKASTVINAATSTGGGSSSAGGGGEGSAGAAGGTDAGGAMGGDTASGGFDGADMNPSSHGKPDDPKVPEQSNELKVLPNIHVKVSGSDSRGDSHDGLQAQTDEEGLVQGTIEFTGPAKKRKAMMNAIINFLLWLLMYLLGKHGIRTTIQKGFKYYLGWQHILCWTGENIGIKKLWMNVYDSAVEQSTETGVWDNDGHVAYKKDNPTGIVANIDDWDMFGGPDEGGGFIGQVRFYFGTYEQQKDPWMVNEMQAPTIEEDLRGLTPLYPMFLTCVVSHANKETGAYIGKQSSMPEMWFEIVNYPNNLYTIYKDKLQALYSRRIGDYIDSLLEYLGAQDASVQNYMSSYIDELVTKKADYDAYYKAEKLKADELEEARENVERAQRSEDSSVIADAQKVYDDAQKAYEEAHEKTESTFSDLKTASVDLRDNYPKTNRDEVASLVNPLVKLLDNGLWTLGKLGEDLNPAEAIYDILTNDLWGCNYDRITDIDVDSLIILGVTCEEEGLGISALITSEAQAGEYVQKILNHINGVMFDDPFTGKLKFKLIRADYKLKDLVTFNPSNCENMKFTRLDWSETSSATSVNFTFADNKYDDSQLLYMDVANKFITRSYKENSVDGRYFTTSTNASWLAQVSQLSSGYPLSAIEFTTNRYGHNVGLAEPIIVDWNYYGIKQQVFRVTDIDYATLTANAIKVTAVEDVFGFAVTKYAYTDVPEWTDPKKHATSIQYYLYLEMPFEWTRSLDTFMYAYAARPTADDIYYVNWRYVGTEYARRNRTNQWSMVAQLVYGTQEIYDEDNNGFEIEIIGTDARQMFDDKVQLIQSYPSVYTNKSAKNLICIDGEILSYGTITKLANGHYNLTNVIHGVFDTIPSDHSAYSKVFFLDYGLATDNALIATQGNYADEQLELRAGTQDEEEEFNVNDIVTFYTKRRSEAPSPMANLKFAAEKGNKTDYHYNYPAGTMFSYDINFIFNLRNKFNQTDNINVHNSVDDAEPEATTQYYIKGSCNSVDFEFKYDASIGTTTPTGTTYTYPTDITLYWHEFCEKMSTRLQRVSDVQLEIGSYNKQKDLYSYDHYDKHIIWHVPRIVGILLPTAGWNEAQAVKTYADSIVTATHIELTTSAYISFTTMTFEEAPLILIANSSTTSLTGITGQDGVRYIPSTTAYRVDGAIGDNDAIVHKIELKPEFVIQNDFTRADGVNRRFYRYRQGSWIETTLYGNT